MAGTVDFSNRSQNKAPGNGKEPVLSQGGIVQPDDQAELFKPACSQSRTARVEAGR